MENKLLPGVYIAYHKDKSLYYRASITHKNKHISLGSFDTQEAAHEAYKEAALILNDSTFQFTNHDSTQHFLSFEKWVVLCNFRDNDLYISNPIYIRPTFFYYYFSKDDFFLFSMEDLFYYSAHKISRRGGHFFVSDYGSQINIFSRYGIMSHGVVGRDYILKNGNPHDMQYSNIEILNSYHGVIVDNSLATPVYNVRIHINGYYQVGSYENATIAAIAYNKAVDTLKEAGWTKQYPTNYIDGLSAKSYADLYTSIQISDKLIAMRNLQSKH